MKSKVNKIKKSSLDNIEKCAEEEIHLIGTLQSFGFLIGFNRKTSDVSLFSEFALSHLSLEKNDLINSNWYSFLNDTENAFNDQNWKKLSNGESVSVASLLINQRRFIVRFHAVDNFVLAEFEEDESSKDISHFYNEIDQFVNASNQATSFKAFSQLFSSQLRNITGYDRVMVYRFDNDYNGEVIAESKKEELEPFLGLHYPHTDIPQQARALYKRKHLRVISDVNADDQSIFCVEEKTTARDIDLGLCTLRSASPIHLEYLRNMGVTATLTVSIMIDKQLWGLVSCHHYAKKELGYKIRKKALLHTQLFSAQIRRWEAAEEYAKVQEKEHIFQSILEEVLKGSDKFEAATSTSYFTGLTESDGGAVIRKGKVYRFGQTPPLDKILQIQSWMQERKEKVFLSNEFSKHSSIGNDIKSVASGVLYYSFDASNKSAMIWFRNQLKEGVKWGGNRNEEDIQNRLSPRRSFEAWEEEVDGKSAQWYSHQIQAGLKLGSFLEKEVFITSLKEQKQKLERLTNQLQSKNEELSQFNWISSHDMKEPLRKIRMFIDQISLEKERLSEDQKNYFERVDRSAARMQKLISDLLDYSKLSKEEAFKVVKLSDVLYELKEHYNFDQEQMRFEIDDLPSMEMIQFQMKQLFSNLISNSIKFKKKDQGVTIQVRSASINKKEVDQYHLNPKLNYFKVTYKDYGIGFEDDYNERIFELFQRLHVTKNYEGTGIGLAICKKVVESHQGEIFANGVKGEGVEFTLILPKYQTER